MLATCVRTPKCSTGIGHAPRVRWVSNLHVGYEWHGAGPASVAAAETSPLCKSPLIGPGKVGAASHFEVPHRFVLGLHSIREEEWLVRDHNVERDLASKAELLACPDTRKHVLGALPGSEGAQKELLALVVDNLSQHHGCSVQQESRERGHGFGSDDIEAAGLQVQEDLAIMENHGDTWVLTAGCICFPSRWSFLSKIGRPMREIHDPVPGLNSRLAKPIERFFDKMKPEMLVLRMNSAIIDSPILFQPGPGGKRLATDGSAMQARQGSTDSPISLDNAGERLLLRMERQTLRRLPKSGAVAFSVHTYQMRLPDVAADIELSVRVEQHYRSLLSTGMEGYKSYVEPFCNWLARARGEQAF